MSEMDMNIQHAPLAEANERMRQVAATMHNALSDMVNQLDAVKTEFTGEAAKEFEEFKRAVSILDQQLSTQFTQGADLLENAHDIIRNGDRKSAYLFQR
ncbi:WXG100 family type VII secretion target [Streptomyces sp. NPDC058579]|uniref:WXG100 family type VII secretion target n=1 Tax=Streptomyces sp. NPDC058579 TaxID=3346548 RepID=UPI0036548D1A